MKYLYIQKIPLIIIYWWWNQISEEYYNNTWEKRKKAVNGKNITTEDILNQWVIPAYQKIAKQLQEAFWYENINWFTSSDIIATHVKELWKVWIPEKFSKQLELDKINLIPFVWTNIDGWELLNINADDIVEKVSEDISEKVSNIIFLTWSWGLVNKEWNIVSFLTQKKLKAILDWKHNNISVDWWMLKKLESVYELFKHWVKKTTITNLWWLKKELETVEWSGTMIVNIEEACFSKLNNFDLFQEIYEAQYKKKNWKQRTQKELEKISQDYIILSLDWTILGWYYLWEIDIDWEKWMLLENIFASKQSGGIWYVLWDQIKKNNKIFTYTQKEDFFQKLWFKKIPWKKSDTWACLFKYEKEWL